MAGASAKAVDFSGVKDRGNFNPKHIAEGDYAATVVKVEDSESKKDQSFQYVFTIKVDKFSQNSYPYYCKLQENQLWKLRNIAVAAGLNVPKKRMKFDPNKVVGKKIGVTMADDEYDGKVKSVIDAVFPVSELADGAEIEDDDTQTDEEFADGAPIAADTEDEFDPEDEAGADEAEQPKKKKDKKGKKKKAADDDSVEEMDISDV